MLDKVIFDDSLESKREAVRSCAGEEVLLRDCFEGTSFGVSYKSGKVRIISKKRYNLVKNNGEVIEKLCYENLASLWRLSA